MRGHIWTIRHRDALIALLLIAGSAGLAHAQAPADIFGLAGARPVKFSKDYKRERNDRDLKRTNQSLDQARKDLRRMQKENSPPDTLRAYSDRVDTLERRQAGLSDSIHAADSAAAAGLPQLDFLPRFDVAVRLAGEGDLQERLLVSGQLIYEVPLNGAANTHIPVFGNFAPLVEDLGTTSADSIASIADELRSTNQGISAGVAPYYVLYDRSGNFSWVPNFVVMGRDNKIKMADGADVDFAQFISGLGLSIGIGAATDNAPRPLAVTISGAYSSFSSDSYKKLFNEDRDHLWNGYLSVLLPVAEKGTGLLFNMVFTSGLTPAWQAGLVLTRKAQAKETAGT